MESKLDDNIDLLRVGMWFHCRSEKEKCTSMFYSIPALKAHFTEKHPDEELKLPENLTQEELDGKVMLTEKPKLRCYTVNCRWCFKSFKTQSQLNFHNKKNPKCYLQPAPDHCYETRRKSTTSKESSPEITGISCRNTQKPRKLQNKRKIKKKRSRAPKRPSQKVRLTFSIRLRCTTCTKSFSNRTSLNRHRKTHLVGSRRKLEENHQPDLQQPHSKSSSLPVPGRQSSTLQISDSRSFGCLTCQKSFPTRYQLTRHSATHSGKCPFKCTCGSCFRTLDGFSKHIKWASQQDQTNHQLVRQLTTKKGKRSFNCTTCGASFNANSSLTRHITIVHGVDNLHSSETAKNSSLGGELTPPTAIKISNSEQKPEDKYQPDLQQPHSKSSSSLPIPEKRSSTPKISASRRFRCGTCQKSFSTRYDFTRHSATHSRKCPFKCTCGSSFRSKNGFSKHIKETYELDKSNHQLIQQLKTKKGEATFPCTTCGASFNANYSLTRHITTVHGVDKLHSSETVNNSSISGGLAQQKEIMISNSEQKIEEKQQPHSKSSSLSVPGKRSNSPQMSNSLSFRCVICQKSFPTLYRLTRHSATHSGERPFKCSCGSCFSTKNGFSKHIKEAYQLDKSNHQLVRQLTTKADESAFKCTTCGASFNWSSSLARHVATVHGVDKLQSSAAVNNSFSSGELTPPTAIKIINSEWELEEKQQHDLQEPYSKSSLPIPDNLSSTPKISDSRRFRCLTCRKSFPTRHRLTRHSAIHTGKRLFKCTCGSGFITKTSFSKHIKTAYQQDKSIHQLDRKLMTQTGELSFNCTTCGASFKWNSNLTRHIATVHRVDNHHGSETVKNTNLSDELTPTAIKISNGEEKLEGQYQPDLQEPNSKSSSTFPVPEKRSSTPQISDSRSFRCAICQKSCSTRYELTRHSATHSGKLPFKCTCGSCFKTMDGFSKHIKSAYQLDQNNHQLIRQLTTKKGELSFNCTTCGASFKWNANLTRHIAAVHNVEKKVEIQVGMVNLEADAKTQGKAGLAPEETKVTITNIKVELNGMKNYRYKCHECPYQGKDPHRFQSHRQLHENGSNVVICSLCGWFLLPSSLALHQNRHHSQTGVKD